MARAQNYARHIPAIVEPVPDADPIPLITEEITQEVRQRNFSMANSLYKGLVGVIRVRGSAGKDIRYVQKAFHELAAEYETLDRKIYGIAQRYAQSLPGSLDRRRGHTHGIDEVVK